MQRKALLIWFVSGALAAIAVGWLAARIHASGHAPVGLTSFGVGVVLGAALSALAASQRLAGARALILGTLLLAILTILAEHAWLYRDFRGQWQEARTKSAAVAMFRSETPPGPREYFAREFNAPLWCFDAVLVAAAAVGAVLVWQRYRR